MGVTLVAEPRAALVDEPLTLAALGAAPGSRLTLRASAVDGAGRAWTSAAEFEADAAGRVDPSRIAPVSGSYGGIDPSGLLWSLAPPAGSDPIPFVKDDVEPLEVAISCELRGTRVGDVTLERLFVAPGVERIPVRERRIVGTFFRPPRLEPGPAVLVLGGSDGGLKEHRAAVLASRGFASLALAHFGWTPRGSRSSAPRAEASSRSCSARASRASAP